MFCLKIFSNVDILLSFLSKLCHLVGKQVKMKVAKSCTLSKLAVFDIASVDDKQIQYK